MAISVTYAQLHTLLRQLNFAEVPIESRYRAFHHTGSDTLIVLANRKQASQAGRTDLTSVRRHLVDNGIVEEHSFDEFLDEGCFPQRD